MCGGTRQLGIAKTPYREVVVVAPIANEVGGGGH